MGEINKPSQRTFWKTTNGDIEHEGYTDIDQVTTTGQPNLVYDTTATNLYPALPSLVGTLLTIDEIYSYDGGMVIVRQTHERTIYPPDETPALFSVYRANTLGLAWVEFENVVKGDQRTYLGNTYKCLQSHQTQQSWNPVLTAGVLWSLLVTTSAWAYPVAYTVNQEVTYQGHTYKCLQAHTSQAGWTPPVVPALWQLVN